MQRFLVVDDSPSVRHMLKTALNQVSPACGVVEASDAPAALAAYRESSPDVVFLDMMMGGYAQGEQILRQILELKVDQRVVMVTGLQGNDPHVINAVSDGAFAILQKPVRLEALRALLDEIRSQEGSLGRIR